MGYCFNCEICGKEWENDFIAPPVYPANGARSVDVCTECLEIFVPESMDPDYRDDITLPFPQEALEEDGYDLHGVKDYLRQSLELTFDCLPDALSDLADEQFPHRTALADAIASLSPDEMRRLTESMAETMWEWNWMREQVYRAYYAGAAAGYAAAKKEV